MKQTTVQKAWKKPELKRLGELRDVRAGTNTATSNGSMGDRERVLDEQLPLVPRGHRSDDRFPKVVKHGSCFRPLPYHEVA